jgi:arylsulfatase A-like enzyme
MRRFAILIAVVLFLAPVTVLVQQPARPNVVYIMSDDLGYGDLGSYGATDIRTPNIDSIARDGVRLTDAYSNGVLCSPTRAALITGRYPQRYAVETALRTDGTYSLKVTGQSLPQLMKNAGYATALIGKWHLGRLTGDAQVGGPRGHGFDYFFGFMGSHTDYWWHNRGPDVPDLWENETRINRDGQYSTTIYTNAAVRFIDQSAAAGRPFFMTVMYNAPHWPYNRPDRPSPAPGSATHVLAQAERTATRDDYRTMVEAMDTGVGQILQALQRAGVANDTLVIFTNDNGGEWLSDPGPLLDRKWTVYEGGIRVPALVRWPGRIPAGRVSGQPAITFDWSASILAAVGITPPPDYDGINLIPMLAGQQPDAERTFFWRAVPGNRNQRAVRRGDWKLIVDTNHTKVFNVRQDPGERRDLTNSRQDIARQLCPLLTAWSQEVNAEQLANEPQETARLQQLAGRGDAPAAGAGRGGRQGGAGDGDNAGACGASAQPPSPPRSSRLP